MAGLDKLDTFAGHAWITVDGESLRETPEILGTYTESSRLQKRVERSTEEDEDVD